MHTGNLAHNFVIFHSVFFSCLLDLLKTYITKNYENININSINTNREKNSDLGTLTFQVSHLVPVLRHNKGIPSK